MADSNRKSGWSDVGDLGGRAIFPHPAAESGERHTHESGAQVGVVGQADGDLLEKNLANLLEHVLP